jgi:hypothetical protein
MESHKIHVPNHQPGGVGVLVPIFPRTKPTNRSADLPRNPGTPSHHFADLHSVGGFLCQNGIHVDGVYMVYIEWQFHGNMYTVYPKNIGYPNQILVSNYYLCNFMLKHQILGYPNIRQIPCGTHRFGKLWWCQGSIVWV